MRKFGYLLAALTISSSAVAQNRIADSCDTFVEAGLTEVSEDYNFTNFVGATRSYLSFSREEFRAKYEAGDFDANASIPIYGYLIGLEASNSSVRDQFSRLREYYSSSNAVDVRRQDIDFVFRETLSAQAIAAWTACIERASQTLPSSNSKIATRLKGQDSEIFQITFNYIPKAETDPQFYVVSSLSSSSGSLPFGERTVAQGTKISRYSGYTQSFVRTDPTKEVTITLDIVGAQSTEILVPALNKGGAYPIGEVIASILPWSQFAAANNDEALYDPAKSRWAPADGRTIANSRLAFVGGGAKAPDLRGVFLRGLNRFSDTEPVPVAVEQKDPQADRVAGSFQADAVGQHKHRITYQRRKNNASNGGGYNHEVADSTESATAVTDQCRGCSVETRPNNRAVHYYLRIN